MNLTPPPAKAKPPELKVYFEDDEACEVFNLVTRRELLKELGAKYNVAIKPMPLGVGCSSLAKFPSKDPYFKEVVLAVDADGVPSKSVPRNLVALPGEVGSDGKGLSPERSIIKYIRALVSDPKASHSIAWSDSRLKKYSHDSLESNLLNGFDDPLSRNAAKAWWKQKRDMLSSWGLYDIWVKVNPTLISKYETNLELAVKDASRAKKAREHELRLGKAA